MADLLSKILLAVIGTALGVISTLLLKKKKILEYDVFSMPLLRFIPKKERTLSVSVDKFLLTGEVNDKGLPTPITSAYGFEIDVRNVGNEEAKDPSIEVILHESAKIVEYETSPASQTNYEVTFERTSPNVLRVFVPYINHRERFLLRIISTENENRDCEVNIRGLGVRARRYSEGRSMLRFMAALAFPVATIILIGWAFPNFFPSLGVVTETETITREHQRFPLWLIICLIIYVAIPLFMFVISDIRNRPRRAKEYGSGGIAKVQEWDDPKRK